MPFLTMQLLLMHCLVNDSRKDGTDIDNERNWLWHTRLKLLGAAGLDRSDKINRTHVYRRVLMNQVKTYADIFPTLADGCLLNETDFPIDYADDMKRASAESF